MNILHISPRIPFPLDTGAKIEIFNSIKLMASAHEITLLVFEEKDNKNESLISPLKELCKRIEIVPRNVSSFLPFKNLFNNTPLAIAKYQSEEMKNKITQMLNENHFDLVRIDHLHLAQYGIYFRNIPKILRMHNVESQFMKRYAQYQTNPLVKFYALLEANRLEMYIKKIWSKFDCFLMVSQEDEKEFKKIAPQANTKVIPIGVDTEYFRLTLSNLNSKQLMFCGSLEWQPNLDAVKFFIKEIFPLVRKEEPETKFLVIGKLPAATKIKQLNNTPGIILKGYVDDVRPYAAESAVFVVPLRIGSGIRVKILETMAQGIPIVSTSLGCEGLEVNHGEHLLIADKPEEFCQHIITLLRNPTLAQTLVRNARKLIEEKYSLKVIKSQLEQIYREVTSKTIN